MKCVNHTDIDATGICAKCGKNLCNDCVRWLHGKTYCHPCAYNIPTQKADAALTSSNQEARRTNANQDKASKFLEASRILLYLALIIGVLIPSCSAIVLYQLMPWPNGNQSTWDPAKFLIILLCTGIALFILAAFCRIMAQYNQHATERTPKPASIMPSEGMIIPNIKPNQLTNQTTLGTKMASAVPIENIKSLSAGLDNTKCINHPETEATGVCAKCGKNLCTTCRHEALNKIYCQSCAKDMLTEQKVVPFILSNIKHRKQIEFVLRDYDMNRIGIASLICMGLGTFLTVGGLVFLFQTMATGETGPLYKLEISGCVFNILGIITSVPLLRDNTSSTVFSSTLFRLIMNSMVVSSLVQVIFVILLLKMR